MLYLKHMVFWNHYKYKNLTLFFLSLIFALILSKNSAFHAFLISLGQFGYIGAFFAGFLFVSTFTIATGALILLILAEKLSPLEIGLIAGLGAVVGDLTIFKVVKDRLINEIQPIFDHFGGNHLKHVLHTKYFSWTLPVVGAIIIASPFPDEIGISLMGITKMKTYKFILLSYVLNSIGIFLVVSASLIIKP